MGESNSTQKETRTVAPISVGSRSRRVKKEKEEDPSDIIIYEASTSSTSEDESGGERGRRKRINKSNRKWESNGISEGWSHETMENNTEAIPEDLKPVDIPEDLKKLAVDEKNLEWDETYRTFHGILYGRDYKKEDEQRTKRKKRLTLGVSVIENYLVHKVTGKETVQGLALKYGVQASDIKKVNRLWTNDELFARKEIVIPTSTEEFLKYQSTLNPTLRSDKASSQDYSSLDKKGQISKFMEIASCEPEIAYYYLVEKNWNFSRALGFYFSQLEGGSDSSDLETVKRKSLDEKQRRALKDEMEEIWEEPVVTKNGKTKSEVGLEAMRNNLPATYLAGEWNTSVNKVQKKTSGAIGKTRR